MEILKMKVEPLSDEEQDSLLDIKSVENEEETFTLSSRTEEADLFEEGFSHTIFEYSVIKEEREENYDEVSEKMENIFVRVKTNESDNSKQGEIISEFSDDDDELDGSKEDVLNVKKEKEFQQDFQQIGCGVERKPVKYLQAFMFLTSCFGFTTTTSSCQPAMFDKL
ncbi:uncharacterized protein LOC106469309 isoform X2 [Limulus polyphemus]|uniref:Uncharacterized protein LOC106469309 isoform X2 n=1 Tax=Limulus polyphemus TaxID=6850 RepID=A0ABM1TC95_LIMPO|nr:uncharacterized protein LOC106469309 isoform X2 [Limulus polyphemus]